MRMILSDPERDAGLRIIETSRLLRSLVEQRLKPYSLTRAQYATLSKLECQDGAAQHEMAKSLEVQPIVMVRLVDQLSAEGLVERRADKADRRCNLLFLTAAGRAKLEELRSFKEQLGAELFDGIDEQDLQRMLAVLIHIRANIKTIQAAEAAAARLKKAGT
jgi:MarR family transcriptional regulator for hemolysin